MNLRESDRTIERIILTGYIISTDYIREVNGWVNESYFESSAATIVYKWCKHYYSEYEAAPKKYILDLYLEHKSEVDGNDSEFIERLLTSLSGEFERRASDFNTQYHVDRTREFCRTKYLELVEKQIKDLREQGRLDEAEACVKDFLPANTARDNGCNPFNDPDGWNNAFNETV